jgi:hypothetical protein
MTSGQDHVKRDPLRLAQDPGVDSRRCEERLRGRHLIAHAQSRRYFD